jgi:hypothetical protein
MPKNKGDLYENSINHAHRQTLQKEILASLRAGSVGVSLARSGIDGEIKLYP